MYILCYRFSVNKDVCVWKGVMWEDLILETMADYTDGLTAEVGRLCLTVGSRLVHIGLRPVWLAVGLCEYRWANPIGCIQSKADIINGDD